MLLRSFATAADDDATRAGNKFFETEVRPLLSQHCFECHGEKKQKGGLRVDNIGFLKTGGDTGPALVPGDPEKSPMIEAVRYKNKDFQMPPKEQLTEAQVAVLEKWIKMGAPWPEDTAHKLVVTEGGFTDEQRNWWSFRPLAKVSPPQIAGGWVRNDIDRFVAQRHAEMKLDPAPEADRRELVRRVYFDLHGLPPTPEQIEAFVNDRSPDAYEKLVDALLASPRYGERWAQHWLDLVRYAESDGYNQDEYRSAVWPYRDWVIKSLNDDKPYDQFVREQLAGDEIAPTDPNVLIATEYLRHPVYEYNQRDVRGQWEIILNDITDTSGELFLGLSFGCARCHNHKFDPILQKDYYRLKAFFAPVYWRDDMKLATPEQKARFAEQQAAWETATADLRAQLTALTGKIVESRVKSAVKKFSDDLKGIINKTPEERDALEIQLAGLCERQMERERKLDIAKSLKTDEQKAKYKELEEKLKAFDSLKPAPLLDAIVATDAGPKGPPTVMKTRKGDTEIAPGFLTILAPGDPEIKSIGNSTGRRTALANWITRPDNQLSTRVIVNRVWQYHFGRGIVATASDFGKLGEKPVFPELLDWLATRFVAEGWSIKRLHREIMLSATYRQTARRPPSELAAKIDPTNRFLWRFNPHRLDAEEVRDAMLAASGELDFKAGGPAEDGNSTRRSIYTMKKRNNQNELLRSLDAPAGFFSTAERQSTTTPTQALLLMNGDWPMQRAHKLASRVTKIDDAWIYALGRPPTDHERAVAEEFVKKRTGGAMASAPSSGEPTENIGEFKENTPHERLLVQTPEKEGDEFTVEAIFTLHSIDTAAAVRTIASRWTGGKDSVEAFGWSLGVTGEKSRFKPRNLIIQLVGEDDNTNIAYEVIPSNVRIELGHRYHASATVSCLDHSVVFRVQDLTQPDAPTQSATVPASVRAKLSGGSSGLVLGGLNKRAVAHQWDGRIEAVRIATGKLPDEELTSADPEKWKSALVNWTASLGPSTQFAWSGTETKAAETADPYRQALSDLCQVLLNTNEFFYLH
jgi:mono/diheme cytochrome c family protein